MPELPEVRAHAERLTDAYGGSELSGFRPISFTALKTFDPPADEAVGQVLGRVSTRGKLLRLEFDTVDHVVHLMQGGRLKDDPAQKPKPRGGQARWSFTDGRALLLTEAGTEHRAGVWTRSRSGPDAEPLIELGPDADVVDRSDLAQRLAGQSMRLHGFLRRQEHIAGLGRRCANEVCHRAKLSPFVNTGRLDADEVARLHEAIDAVIDEGLAYERTRDDMSSSKDRPGAVHHRAGESCPVCDDEVREVVYNRYTVSYCPTCQTDGKILADNTTSKFLK